MTEAVKRTRPWPHVWAISSVLSALALLALAESGALEAPQIYILAALPIGLMAMTVISGLASSKNNPASHRYLGRMALTMAFYLVTLILAEHFIEDRGVSGAGAVILAALPGVSFAGIVWIFGGLIVEEKDEFYRMLYVRQGLIATGISFTLAAIWGFLETYQVVEHVAAFWWPTIWCFGIGIGAIANKLKYGTFGEIR